MRACVTARSILKLCELQETQYGISYLDHASIASLSRALIENVAVVRYIGDIEISEDEWNCRKLIVDVHDCVNRTEFLRLLGDESDEAETLKRLQARLKENIFFTTLQANRQQRLLNGEDMFIDGRHRSMLVFGWGDGHTRGIYKYLSHQSHSLSMAFHRTQANDLYAPNSQYARAIAGASIDWARHALGYGVLHMVSLFPYVEAAFDPAIFQGLKSQYTPNDISQPRAAAP
jgi:hypothetical protein